MHQQIELLTRTTMTGGRLNLAAGQLNATQTDADSCGRIPRRFLTQRPNPGLSAYLPRTAVCRAGRGCCTGGGGALQSHQGHGRWAAAQEESAKGGGAGSRKDAPPRLSLSPGRKCLVSLSSSSSWLLNPSGAPFRSCSVRPPQLPESSWAERLQRLPPFVANPQQTPRIHRRRADTQTKHGAGCKRGRNDMQLCRLPVIGWPSSRVRCHWANVVKVTGQTRNSQIQTVLRHILLVLKHMLVDKRMIKKTIIQLIFWRLMKRLFKYMRIFVKDSSKSKVM